MTQCGTLSLATVFMGVAALATTAQAQCDAQLLASLRTQYTINTNSELSDVVHQLTCGNINETTSVGASYTGYYGILGLDGDNEHIASACAQNDKAFFQKNSLQMAYSFVPPYALSVCGSGLYLTASQSSDNNRVVVRATYVPDGSGHLARVKSISWGPEDGLNCDDTKFMKYTRLIPGGREMACERKTDQGITITLKTTHEGDKTIYLPHRQSIEIRPIKWDHYVYSSYFIKCKDISDPANPIPRGEFFNCHDVGACAEEPTTGYCASKFGTRYVLIDGQRADVR